MAGEPVDCPRAKTQEGTSNCPRWQRWAALTATALVSANPNQAGLTAVEKAKVTEKIPNMVRVEKGSFQMGDLFGDPKYRKALPEVPVHEVELDPFEIGKYEVTVAEFRAFIKETGYLTSAEQPSGRPFPGNWQRMPYPQADNEPVLDVSWDDAIRYCNWVSRQGGLPPAFDEKTGAILDEKGQVTTDVRKVQGYRLPTEAEWEFAARERGKKVRFGNSQDIARSEEINFDASVENASLPKEGRTNRARSTPVDSFQPNALGLYNMSGNAWEWCLDRAENYQAAKQKNPFTAGGQPKIIRGGGLTCDVTIIRNSARFCFGSGQSCPASGIRLARSVE